MPTTITKRRKSGRFSRTASWDQSKDIKICQ